MGGLAIVGLSIGGVLLTSRNLSDSKETPILEPTQAATDAPTEETFTFHPALGAYSCLVKGLPATACTGVAANDKWTLYTEKKNGVEMALVPAGCFSMGSEDGENNERPVHKGCFAKPFWIDVYEVTNAQFTTSGGDLPQRSREGASPSPLDIQGRTGLQING